MGGFPIEKDSRSAQPNVAASGTRGRGEVGFCQPKGRRPEAEPTLRKLAEVPKARAKPTNRYPSQGGWCPWCRINGGGE